MSNQPTVVGIDEQDEVRVEVTRWTELARQVLEAEGIGAESELNVTFVSEAEMTRLNESHMEKSGPTDVLAFPLDDDPTLVPEGQPRLLGDVVICPGVVAAQAPAGVEAEMALMVVHGVLHILGMDHAETDEAAAMRAAERRHLDRWVSA